ncbi:peptidoglycan-binding protein [Streptomyces rishiriensis]|uniref:peptidoglycan-binding protein n=1 Tax=Streptomyces rishiriensis TaxID=68264 RepID=UPI0037AA5585
MSAFTIDVSHPFPVGFTGGLGGPHQGGHQPPDWYIEYGMDLGAGEGTEIHAAFDAHITKYSPHDPAADSGKVYGAQLFMRVPNNEMGGFYTHMTNVPAGLTVGSSVARGDLLGRVHAFAGIPPHLHLALVEIIGGLPGGQYQGVDLYQLFLDTANSGAVTPITFNQDGSPPALGAVSPKVLHLGTIRGVQEALTALGFDPGVVDGIDGPKTQGAVMHFQAGQGLEQDGVCTGATRDALAAVLQTQGFLVNGA